MRTAKQLAWLLGVIIGVVLEGCVSEPAARSDKTKLVEDAERYISELKAQNNLPGYSSTEHGKLIALAAFDSEHASYPATVTVRGWKDGDETMYCYTLKKDTEHSPWRLVAATRLMPHDKLTEMFVPK